MIKCFAQLAMSVCLRRSLKVIKTFNAKASSEYIAGVEDTMNAKEEFFFENMVIGQKMNLCQMDLWLENKKAAQMSSFYYDKTSMFLRSIFLFELLSYTGVKLCNFLIRAIACSLLDQSKCMA